MTFLTNWVFWAILGVIIVLMAIVGYLAEGTDLLKKKDKKPKKEKVTEVTTPENTDSNQPSAWTGEVKKEDEHHEQVYTVPSVDDWSAIPTVNDTVNAAPTTETQTQPQNMPFSNMNPNTTMPNMQPANSSNLVSELSAEVNTDLTNNSKVSQPSITEPVEPALETSNSAKDNQVDNSGNNQNIDALSVQPVNETLDNTASQTNIPSETNPSVLSTQPVDASIPLNMGSSEINNSQNMTSSADSIWK